MPSPTMPGPDDSSSLLDLLRSAPSSALRLSEIIDGTRRSVHQEVEQHLGSFDADIDAETVRRLDAYAKGPGPGAADLGHRLSDVRHALKAVQHDLYLRLTVGQRDDDGTAQVSRRSDLLKLATAVGSSRVATGPTGAVVITFTGSRRTVFLPVASDVAHQLRVAAKKQKEATERRAEDIRGLLAQHVRMADWSDPQAIGVAIGCDETAATVSWWESHVTVGPSPWVEGGVRALCAALLTNRCYVVALANDGTLRVTA